MGTILTIGELLWDIFPDGNHLGGVPANVAYHLAQMGHRALLVSAVGQDELGRRAVEIIRAGGVDTGLVAEDPTHQTGIVQVELDADGVATFDITRDVAWDRIPATAELLGAVEQVDAIAFGTLAQRHPTSRATIAAALTAGAGCPRILDLNLRPPFFDPDVVAGSLAHATILKLNEDEILALPELLGLAAGDEFLPRLAATYDLDRIYITRGPDGCEVHTEGRTISRPAPPVTVADTVGAGDAFTAALIDGELRGLDAGTIATNACATGAFVAAQAGAMPRWTAALRTTLGLPPR